MCAATQIELKRNPEVGPDETKTQFLCNSYSFLYASWGAQILPDQGSLQAFQSRTWIITLAFLINVSRISIISTHWHMNRATETEHFETK